MKIDTMINSTPEQFSLGSHIQGPNEHSVSQDDSEWFQKAIENSDAIEKNKGSAASGVIDKIAEMDEQLKHFQERSRFYAEKHSKTGSNADYIEYMKASSDLNIRTMIVTKTIAKATGAVEKLTNMQ